MLKKLSQRSGSTSFEYWTTDIAAPEGAMKIVRNQQLELLPYGTSQGSKIYRETLHLLCQARYFHLSR